MTRAFARLRILRIMVNDVHRFLRKGRRGFAVMLLTVIAIGCEVLAPETEKVREPETASEDLRTTMPPVSGLEIAVSPSPSPRASGFDQERVWSPFIDWEPALAVDPFTSDVYQLTTRFNGPRPCEQCQAPYVIFRHSSDGGATWGPDQFLKSRKDQNDPQIEVADDGTVFIVWLDDDWMLRLIKSTDHGATWTKPVPVLSQVALPAWGDKPLLVVSPDGQDVYVAFNAFESYVAVSHDGGETFEAPVKTSNNHRGWYHTGGALAPDGTVYFVAGDYSLNFLGDAGVRLIKSTDRGSTWQTITVDRSKQAPDCPDVPGCYTGFLGPSPSVDVDAAGLLMVAYNAGDAPGAPQPMYIRTSTDGGRTWSPRLMVSEDGPIDNAFPVVRSGPSPGDFRLVWQDDRTGRWNTWYRSTTDSGATWTPAVRLSDLDGGAPYKDADGYDFVYGDYLEMEVDGAGVNHVIWGAGKDLYGIGGTWYTRGQ